MLDPFIIRYKDWGNGIASTRSAFLLEMETVEYYLWGDLGDLISAPSIEKPILLIWSSLPKTMLRSIQTVVYLFQMETVPPGGKMDSA